MSRRGVVAALVVAPWVAFAVVRGLGLERGYPLVPLMAYTPLMAFAAWLPVVVALALRRRVAAAVAVAAGIVLLGAVLPRAVDDGDAAVAGGRELTVMTINLQFGEGDLGTVLDLVRRHRVDLLSLQELPPDAARTLEASGVRAQLPFRALDARPGPQGSGLLARFPLRDQRRPQGTRLAMPEARLTVPGGPAVLVKSVHPAAPVRGDVGVWTRELRDLPRATPAGPLRLLAGDFNATLDHRELRRLLDSGYEDAAEATGEGLGTTWPEGRLVPPEVTIDHVLADRRIAVLDVGVHTVPGSDHRAVVARLRLPA